MKINFSNILKVAIPIILISIILLFVALFEINYTHKQLILKTKNINRFDKIAINFEGKKYTNLIVFGLPGDTVEIIKGIPYLNGKPYPQLFSKLYLIDISNQTQNQNPISIIQLSYQQYQQLKKKTFVQPVVLPKNWLDTAIYPFSKKIHWNADNFGKFIVPKANMILKLTPYTYELYRPIIQKYETQKLEFKNKTFYLNGQPVKYFKFSNDYYFLLNQNLNQCYDSRCFGPIPRKLIIGKIIFSLK